MIRGIRGSIFILLIILIVSNGFCNGSLDKYGGWTGLKGEKRPVFSAQNINGRWWLVTPEGNVFWAVGVYCVRFGGLAENGTGIRAYKEANIEKYGGVREWARVTRLRLRDWGFNTIADWSSEEIFREPGFAYTMGIDLPKGAPDVIPEGFWGYFPDVFSDEFQDSVTKQIEKTFREKPYLLDDKWLLGYFLADDTPWFGSKGRHDGLVHDYINLDSEQAGKKAWVEFVKSQYSDVNAVNQSWGTKFRSMDDLLNARDLVPNKNLKRDNLLFLKIIADRFCKVLTETLRKYDPYHMILGMRPTRSYPEVVEAIGKYSDVFTISYYGLNQGYKISPNYEEEVKVLYNYGKRPIILGMMVDAQDAKLPYGNVRTQKDRGISYWRYLAKLASDPRVVGGLWFQYFDPPVKCYDSQASNWGFVNDQDVPYEDFVNLAKQANALVYSYALGLTNFVPEFDSLMGLVKEEIPDIKQESSQTIFIPILNSGFENDGDPWKFQVWKGNSKVSIDSKEKKSGKSSIRIIGGPDKGWDSVGVSVQSRPRFMLIPGLEYTFSGWIKTDSVEDTAFLRIKLKNNDGAAEDFLVQGAYGTQDWTRFENKYIPKQKSVVEYIGVQLVGRGTAWFDDLALEVSAPESLSQNDFVGFGEDEALAEDDVVYNTKKLILSNPGFENGETAWKLQAWKGKPKVRIDKEAYSGRKGVKIQGDKKGWDSVGVAVQPSLGIAMEEGKRYLLTGWAKTEKVEGKAFLRIKIDYDGGGSDYIETGVIDGTGDWVRLSKKFSPKNNGRINYLSCQLVGKGTVWFDDVSLEEVEE
ncbi:MAG: carbohydrate binding domain-containing protein [Candidatus Omnitrophota bacterium]